jgi:uncharacterized protein (DUF952 family)
MLFHFVKETHWEKVKKDLNYFSERFNEEGFIHLCTFEQINGVLERYFKSGEKLVQLSIDEEKLTSRLVYESLTGGESFPHVYGAINTDSIFEIKYFSKSE